MSCRALTQASEATHALPLLRRPRHVPWAIEAGRSVIGESPVLADHLQTYHHFRVQLLLLPLQATQLRYEVGKVEISSSAL
mmetsp:Transcript_42113/g.83305  ORF Transcript_42113/g.83305 Transcript_42113/m.83305 type:complete len:81 (-) Transcript_42113:1624-1866(-)